MSYFQARLAEVQIPPKKPQKYLFHVPRTKETNKPKQACLSLFIHNECCFGADYQTRSIFISKTSLKQSVDDIKH